MSKENMKIGFVLGMLVGLPLLAMVLVGLLPVFFNITGDWSAYLYWMPISLLISRIMYFICIPLYIGSFIFDTSKTGYLLAIPSLIILGFWGIPLLETNLIALVSTELSGLILQRTILQILVVELLSIGVTLSTKASEGKKKD